MSADIIQLNPEAFQTELKGLVKNSIEELQFTVYRMANEIQQVEHHVHQ